MTSNSNPFWGSSEIGMVCSHTSQDLDSHIKPLNWDCFFDFKESIDPKSSLELLQGPIPCHYEPQDEWLVEFEGLQKVHDRAPTMGTPTPPPYQKQDTVTTSSDNSYGIRDASRSWQGKQGKRKSPPTLCHPPIKFSKTDRSACLDEDGPDCPTPTPTGCQCVAEGRSADGSDAIIYAPTLVPHIRTASDIEKIMRELKELELLFQADIKLRKFQVEASRPGYEPAPRNATQI
ncbi:hypothetical protein F5B18DRAFT_646949 [Nemania serpens]|nr:hypothetical protein F5B18DRAFT_646949 [Nemania serpens]